MFVMFVVRLMMVTFCVGAMMTRLRRREPKSLTFTKLKFIGPMSKSTSTLALKPTERVNVASGGSGAQPTCRSLRRHETHAGPHSVPGTHTQPTRSTRAQRP